MNVQDTAWCRRSWFEDELLMELAERLELLAFIGEVEVAKLEVLVADGHALEDIELDGILGEPD